MPTRLRLPRRSLMVRLVGSFLILSVLMVAAVGVLAYIRARHTLQSSIYARLDAAVAQKSGAVNSWPTKTTLRRWSGAPSRAATRG